MTTLFAGERPRPVRPQQQRRSIIPAPGAVFVRLGSSYAEMTPGEAISFRAELDRAIGIALAARDGRQLLSLIPDGKPRPVLL